VAARDDSIVTGLERLGDGKREELAGLPPMGTAPADEAGQLGERRRRLPHDAGVGPLELVGQRVGRGEPLVHATQTQIEELRAQPMALVRVSAGVVAELIRSAQRCRRRAEINAVAWCRPHAVLVVPSRRSASGAASVTPRMANSERDRLARDRSPRPS